MRRTTIFADDDLIKEMKSLAEQEKRSVADLVRDAIAQYISNKRRRKQKLSFIGIGRSGRSDISEKHEELLWQRPSR
jgi:metal-responsive CopG/Arc/MetJ family transcriptional regulator